MRFSWPKETQFHRLVLDVEQKNCAQCGRRLSICDHRIRHVYSLEHPLEICCRLRACESIWSVEMTDRAFPRNFIRQSICLTD